MMVHHITQAENDELPPHVTEWQCDQCSWRVKLNTKRGTKQVLDPGDEYANHSGNNFEKFGQVRERPDLAETFDVWRRG